MSAKAARELGLPVDQATRAKPLPRGKGIDFAALCVAAGLPRPVAEFRFHPVRLWRIDFCWPLFWTALEIEGISPEGTRHQRIAGFRADLEKYNELALAGYRLLRVTSQDIASGAALELVRRALEGHGR